MARPSKFETNVEMAKAAWAPVLKVLSNEDLANLDKIPFDPKRSKIPGWHEYNLQHLHEPVRKRLWYPSVEQIVEIHDDMIDEFGGKHGILDIGKVDSAIDRIKNSTIFGVDQFPTIYDKAASLIHSILTYHPFWDGQKRTGIAAAFVFLGMNGWTLWSRDYKNEVHFAVQIAKGQHEVDSIREWIIQRTAPQKALGDSRGSVLRHLVGEDVRASCHFCGRKLSCNRFRTYCENCDVWYETEVKHLARTFDGKDRPTIKAKAGLHQLQAWSGKGLTPEKLRRLARRQQELFKNLQQSTLFNYAELQGEIGEMSRELEENIKRYLG